MPKPEPIRTERLELIPAEAETAAADVNEDRMALEDLLDALIPDEWPEALYRDARPVLATTLAERPAEVGWWSWYVVHDEEAAGPRTLIGSAGFKGPPDSAGVVEIGYGVLNSHRGRRFATEAVRGLLRWALRDERVQSVAAETFPDLEPSLNIITRLGMSYAGDSSNDPGAVRFAISRRKLEQRMADW